MSVLSRRAVLSAGLGVLAAAVDGLRLSAEDHYPQRPITIIVPWPPGGVTDIVGRLLAQAMSSDLGQPVVVDNRAGASGTIGHTLASRAAADGYTLLLATNSTYAMAPYLFKKLAYDSERAFTPIGLVVISPQVLCVHSSVPVTDVKAFLEYVLVRKPGEVTFESSGPGSSSHLAMELFMRMADLSMLHVPYRGGGPAAQALVSGEVNAGFVDAVVAIPLSEGGNLRMLGVSTKERLPLAPDLPTIAESGVPEFQSSTDASMFALAGTPPTIIGRISAAMQAALRIPEVRNQLMKIGAIVVGGSPEEFPAYFAAENGKWRETIKARGIKM